MAIYSLGALTTNVTSGNAAATLIASATDRLRALEIGLMMVTGTSTTLGFGRPAAVGITPTAPTTVLAENDADPVGTGKIALAWTTQPTAPTNFLRRFRPTSAIGSGYILSFPKGISVPVSGNLAIWNSIGGGTLETYWVIDE